jgi:hypothetical protein
MIIRRYRMLHVLALTVVTIYGSAARSTAQVTPELLELRAQLVEARNDDYIAVRDEAMALPKESFDDLLFLLRLTPEYSLERTLALILEARAAHPEEAARFDRELSKMVENPTLWGSRSGAPIYHSWTNVEVNEVHPLVYEVVVKRRDLPGPVRFDVRGMTNAPNPGNIPFILFMAKHYGPGVLFDLVAATEGYPEEREWLRPLAVKLYKEHRDRGNVGGAGAFAMFYSFGTAEDLKILRELRDFEAELLPAEGIVIADRREVGRARVAATDEYERRKVEMEQAEREGVPESVIERRREALMQAEVVAREAIRQRDGNYLWRRLNESIQRLEARLKQGDDGP